MPEAEDVFVRQVRELEALGKVEVLSRRVRELETLNRTADERVVALEKANIQLRGQISDLRQHLKARHEAIDRQMGTIVSHEDRLKALGSINADLRTENEMLEARNAELEAAHQRAIQVAAERDDAQAKQEVAMRELRAWRRIAEGYRTLHQRSEEL